MKGRECQKQTAHKLIQGASPLQQADKKAQQYKLNYIFYAPWSHKEHSAKLTVNIYIRNSTEKN
jgi:hypothetical protein